MWNLCEPMSRLLRNSNWSEVLALFHGCERYASLNANGWTERYGLRPPDWRHCNVTLQAWTDDELRQAMQDMSALEPRLTVDMVDGKNNALLPPRVDGLPAVMVRFSKGFGIIDGKHRANQWKQRPGEYAVIVVESGL